MSSNYFNQNVQRFSIRKYSLGAASVLLGVFLLSAAQTARADEVNIETASSQIVEVSKNDPVEAPVTQTVGNSIASRSINVQSDGQEKSEVTSIESLPVKEDTANVLDSVSNESKEVTTSDSDSKHNLVSNQGQEDSKEDSRLPHAGVVEKSVEDVNNVTPIKEESKEQDSTTEKKNESPRTTGYSTFFNMGAFRRASANPRIGDDYPWPNAAIPYKEVDSWGLYKRECVSFVAYRLSSVNGFTIPWAYGNANQWGYRAQKEGYRVDMNPTPGSVAWFTGNKGFHVAWVVGANGDNVEIEEYNYGYNNKYNHRVIPRNSASGYIHFKDLTGGTSGGGNTGTTHKPINNPGSSIPSSGTYTFTGRVSIKAEPKLSAPELAYYDAGNAVNYDKTLQADGHEWISYLSYSGARRYIPVRKLVTEVTPIVKGTINVQNKNDQAGTFDVVISNVSSNAGLKEITIPIWSVKDGQDDMVWYKADKQGDGTYKTSVKISDHKNDRGEYLIHLYYKVDSGKLVGAGGTSVTINSTNTSNVQPHGVISVVNKDNQSGTFDVIISEIVSPNGLKEVSVPIWATQNGQDDLVWYKGQRQADGTYKVSVKASNHKNYKGEYNIHLYYVQDDGKMVGAGGTTTTVDFVSRPSIPNSGTYTFTGRASIKAEPKIEATELAYYDAGNTVNYDSVIQANGHYWISYLSYSGARRYIAIS